MVVHELEHRELVSKTRCWYGLFADSGTGQSEAIESCVRRCISR